MARQYVCNKDYPVVETKAGKLRGFLLDGVFTFLGVDYADAQRFCPPVEVTPWEGIKDATAYGAICPTNGNPVPSGEHFIPHRFWPANEHCLNLNLWTKSLDKNAKRPVIVWFHGGGYTNGSALEHVGYEGDALCDYGDVVVITVNHRLNIIGHLDLASFSDKYKNSCNAGIEDLVACLRWVKENIEGFGGDPDNVTIWGQSGGGGKVCTLMQTPEAAGLFHRAYMMSGGAGTMASMGRQPIDHRPVVEGILKELNIPEEEIERLEKVPYSVLCKAYNRVARKTGIVLNWAPKANDWYIGHPVEVGFSEYAKKVPLIVSSTFAEFTAQTDPFGLGFDASETEKIAALEEMFGKDTAKIMNLFKTAYPDKDVLRLGQIDRRTRLGVTNFMDVRAACNAEAPAYNYLFDVEFEVDSGTPSWHCSDIAYTFHNSHRVGCCNMAGGVTEKLEEEMAGMLVAFAKTGDPNHAGMPEWKPYTKEENNTFVFKNAQSLNLTDYDRPLVAALMECLGNPVFNFNHIPDEDDETRGAWMY